MMQLQSVLMPHKEKKEHADGHQSNKHKHHAEHKPNCKKYNKISEEKKETQKHEEELVQKMAKLEIQSSFHQKDYDHIVAPGKAYKIQCMGGFVMSGRGIQFRPDHTYKFYDSGSTNCSDCDELTFSANIDINGTWTYDETSRKLTLLANSWRGWQDYGNPIDQKILDKQVPKKLEIQDWDFSKSEINIYDANWSWGHFGGISLTLLKCYCHCCRNIQ